MAQVVVEMSSDEAKLYRGMQRIIEQQNKLDRGNKKVQQSGKQAGKEQEQAFGPRAAGQLANYAAESCGPTGELRGRPVWHFSGCHGIYRPHERGAADQ